MSLTIDAELQAYGRKLMKNKRGGIVAIQVKTGEILSLITEPTYDPSILIGRKRSRNYTKIYRDSITRPLYNRALQAQYHQGHRLKCSPDSSPCKKMQLVLMKVILVMVGFSMPEVKLWVAIITLIPSV